MEKNTPNYVILTGAGFSRDFGGLLATDMWGVIHSKLSEHTNGDSLLKIRKLMVDRGESKYEDIYTELEKHSSQNVNCEDSNFDQNDFEAYKKAVEDAYTTLNDNMGASKGIPGYNRELIPRLRTLLNAFWDKYDGEIFTLNQDLLIESQCGLYKSESNKFLNSEAEWPHTSQKVISGFENIGNMRKKDIKFDSLSSGKDQHINVIKYYKLHGSLNWRNEIGELLILFGKEKDQIINESSIFKEYHEKFCHSLRNAKVLTIGYSFNDEHINQLILDEKNEIELHILDPEPPSRFAESMSRGLDSKKAVLDKLNSYYPWSLGTYLENEEIQKVIHKSYFDNAVNIVDLE